MIRKLLAGAAIAALGVSVAPAHTYNFTKVAPPANYTIKLNGNVPEVCYLTLNPGTNSGGIGNVTNGSGWAVNFGNLIDGAGNFVKNGAWAAVNYSAFCNINALATITVSADHGALQADNNASAPVGSGFAVSVPYEFALNGGGAIQGNTLPTTPYTTPAGNALSVLQSGYIAVTLGAQGQPLVADTYSDTIYVTIDLF